jgi:ATP-dependent helicase/nuclease subunit A
VPTTDHRTRAASELDRDLAVTAGAGAGKTTVLVDRFVAIATDPAVGPEHVLAITFTRKAAVEMKERVIRELEKRGEVALRRATEGAYISTIHGFAERILRERPFDARIDPAFGVITDYDKELWIEEALQEMYERKDLREFAPRLKKSFEGGWKLFVVVREVARLLREGPAAAQREASVVHDDDACVKLALDRLRERVRAADLRMLECMRALAPMLDGASFTSRKKMYELSRRYLDAVQQCVAAKSVQGVAAEEWKDTRFTGQIAGDEREPIRRLLDEIRELAPNATFSDFATQEALERELLPLKRAIYSAAAAIGKSYDEHKRSIGALDFHDLQVCAARLLAGNERVRREYADRFRHILLDESQDTDELQYGIIESLRTPDNTLFMVGDPKQAIYEFRGASPDVFHAAVEKLDDACRLQLPENFRSRPEIIAFVNAIGEPLLGAQFVPIVARADYGGEWLDTPAVTAILAEQALVPQEEGKPKPESVSVARPREAAAVAEEVVRLLRERPLVKDPTSRTLSWVPLQPKHVAILFRTRTAIPYFERALAERGVPYVTAAAQGFYERAEVLDCMMMLRVLAQPLDDLALAAVLRSPFVGASDADLWRLRAPAEDRGVPPLYHALRGHEPLTGFRDALRSLRARMRGASASDALESALRAFSYEAAVAAHVDGPAMLANLAKLRRRVRDLGAISPGEAFDELQRTRALMTQEATAPLVGERDDVVVLTTIHQAKGLEWPVVCLPNLQGAKNNRRDDFSPRHGVLLCKALNAAGEEELPLSVSGIIREIAARTEAEERRLLYVALTRARERLILSACVKEREDAPAGAKASSAEKFASPLAFLQAQEGTGLIEPGEHEGDGFRTRVTYVRGDVLEKTAYQGGELLAASFTPTVVEHPAGEATPIAALPLSLKVTELLAYQRCPQVYRFSHELEIEENLPRRAALRGSERPQVSPVEMGTIVHAQLERARFDVTDRDGEVARLVAEQEERARPALSRMLRAVLDGEIGDAVRSAQRVEREWPFAMRVAGVTIEGVIDLAIQGQDGRWTVVDYKSNDFSRRGRLEYLVDYYAPQLDLYATALAGAGLGAVAECALVFLMGPKVHRWAFDRASAATREWASATVTRIAARDYVTSAGPKCELCGYRKRKVCDIGRAWTPTMSVPRGPATSAMAPPGRPGAPTQEETK